jgi:hypothetical protein
MKKLLCWIGWHHFTWYTCCDEYWFCRDCGRSTHPNTHVTEA